MIELLKNIDNNHLDCRIAEFKCVGKKFNVKKMRMTEVEYKMDISTISDIISLLESVIYKVNIQFKLLINDTDIVDFSKHYESTPTIKITFGDSQYIFEHRRMLKISFTALGDKYSDCDDDWDDSSYFNYDTYKFSFSNEIDVESLLYSILINRVTHFDSDDAFESYILSVIRGNKLKEIANMT